MARIRETADGWHLASKDAEGRALVEAEEGVFFLKVGYRYSPSFSATQARRLATWLLKRCDEMDKARRR